VQALGALVGKAEVRGDTVFVNDVPVHNVIAERIISLASRGFPVDPILRFLELVLQNPNSKAQLELYDFLSNRNLPLTEDGHFLAYKRVRDDWLDIYSATIDNSIGRVVEVPRESVDSDRSNHCSHGLHVGALDYVNNYSSGGHIVIVKVNPMDVVSVPTDCNFMKLRTCRYEVLREMHTKDPLEQPCYSTSGDEFKDVSKFAEANRALLKEDAIDGDWTNWEDEEMPKEEESSFGEPTFDDDTPKVFYDSWTLDELAYECRDRKLTESRQAGRDLGKKVLIQMLMDDDRGPEEDDWESSSSEEDWNSSSTSCW
jgi:hypothetical protein